MRGFYFHSPYMLENVVHSKWSSTICCSIPRYLFVTTIFLCKRIFVLLSSNFFYHKINGYQGVNEVSKEHRNLV